MHGCCEWYNRVVEILLLICHEMIWVKMKLLTLPSDRQTEQRNTMMVGMIVLHT